VRERNSDRGPSTPIVLNSKMRTHIFPQISKFVRFGTKHRVAVVLRRNTYSALATSVLVVHALRLRRLVADPTIWAMEGAILDRLISVDAFHDNLAPWLSSTAYPAPNFERAIFAA